MNNKAQGALLILSTILITSTLTYLITKAKYKNRPIVIQQEEKKPAEQKKETEKPEAKVESNAPEKVDVTKYAEKYKRKNQELTRDYGYPEDHDEIQIIDDMIFKSNPDVYEPVTYTLYLDNVLVDEIGERVYDPDNSVGRNTIERFNELEVNNAVYVRNHKTRMDYEILRDPVSYAEAKGHAGNGRS